MLAPRLLCGFGLCQRVPVTFYSSSIVTMLPLRTLAPHQVFHTRLCVRLGCSFLEALGERTISSRCLPFRRCKISCTWGVDRWRSPPPRALAPHRARVHQPDLVTTYKQHCCRCCLLGGSGLIQADLVTIYKSSIVVYAGPRLLCGFGLCQTVPVTIYSCSLVAMLPLEALAPHQVFHTRLCLRLGCSCWEALGEPAISLRLLPCRRCKTSWTWGVDRWRSPPPRAFAPHRTRVLQPDLVTTYNQHSCLCWLPGGFGLIHASLVAIHWSCIVVFAGSYVVAWVRPLSN